MSKVKIIETCVAVFLFLIVIGLLLYSVAWKLLPEDVTYKERAENAIVDNEIMKDIRFNYSIISIDTEKDKEPIYHLDFEMINGDLKFQKRLSQSDYIQYLGEDFNTITTDIYYLSIEYPFKKIWWLDYSYEYWYRGKKYYRYSFLQETDFTESEINKIINDYLIKEK